MPQILRDALDTISDLGYINNEIPRYIIDNLNPAFPLRPYQIESLTRLFYYLNDYPKRTNPAHLLFHMATGSGKTLIMASALLHLYYQGYRNFIFFVNSTNIIDKTRENFLNPLSSKYLFSEKIKYGPTEVIIQDVGNFQSTNDDDIQILFTTIQGLHTHLNEPRENCLTYEDFSDKDIVLISDEAHHINALTKKELNNSEVAAQNTWEATVNRIFSSRPGNILMEFTATIELDHPAIREKYLDKILYQYWLKDFRRDGYSKEVNVLQADMSPVDRALQAAIISQFRRKVAEKHGIQLKPVILMKSRTIAESEIHEKEFRKCIDGLLATEIEKLKDTSDSKVFHKALDYFDAHSITLTNLAAELREDFSDQRCLVVNSKADSEEKQLLVNSLEDADNPIRVIFAVNKLNEGWDVLNLFDIVRLYNTRDAKHNIPGKTTIAEAQLIGRGARYFPFCLEENQVLDKRKFDHDLTNELRILEELYYHSAHNPRYIDELHKALVETGIVPSRTRKIDLRVKPSFKNSEYWKNGLIFSNNRIQNPRVDIFGLENFSITGHYTYSLKTGQTLESALLEEHGSIIGESISQTIRFTDFGLVIIRKALNKLEFYGFRNLKEYVPRLKSISEFISSDDYLNSVVVEVHGNQTQLDNLNPELKLAILINILQKISREIQSGTSDYIGTKTFKPQSIQHLLKDKTLNISINEGGNQEYGIGMRETSNSLLQLNLLNKDWYVYDENYGTSEEKHLIKYLNSIMEHLQSKFEDIYLIRNDHLLKIYKFADGATIEPDFILFATEKESGTSTIYQIFIEPKGDHLLEKDKWKGEFLKDIEHEARIQEIAQNKEYRIVGLPLYNETHTKIDFDERLKEILLQS